ncbi:hypothetical protein HYH03_005555 [Edaphochlamys debaryana]|uniref:RING-type domain-containing protein n=1 Tax=Edaphochlamys debaryana TaxID=47281 RepID=A0A835Y5E9_9CHLO|nr:hypothetical protein HYH03_005555 [Edaphochlamys debaryana]|eukprot:KAG2496323.1 hypothetical protein HYH03_005555 [Edaphochlamys debaryana]
MTPIEILDDEEGSGDRAEAEGGAHVAASALPPPAPVGESAAPSPEAAPPGAGPSAPPAAAAPAATTMTGECVICMEPYEAEGDHSPVFLRCGHHAGKQCMEQWIHVQKKCPQCRVKATLRQLIRIFNLPALVVAGGGPVTPAAPAQLSELAQREVMLQAAQRAKAKAEEEAREKDREAKRLRTERDQAHQSMEALRRQAQAAQAALAERDAKHQQQLLQLTAAAQQAIEAQRQQCMQQMQSAVAAAAATAARATGAAGAAGCSVTGATPPAPAPAVAASAAPGAAAAPLQPTPQPKAPSTTLTPPPAVGVTQPPPAPSAPVAPQAVTQAAPPTAAASGPAAGAMWGHYTSATPAPSPPPTLVSSSSFAAPGPALSPQPATFPWLGSGPAAPVATSVATPAPIPEPPPFERLFWVSVSGCRLAALDPLGGCIMVTEQPATPAGGGASWVRKISLASWQSSTRIMLPPTAGIACDLQVAPPPPGLAAASYPRLTALVTRGLGLSLICPRADSVVATFAGLPHKPVSVSWVPTDAGPTAIAALPTASPTSWEHVLVAGLERGHVALLDTRRTSEPVAVLAPLQVRPTCAQLPVRTVAALPSVGGPADAAGGGARWPAVALSCPRGAWLMAGAEGSPEGGPAMHVLGGGFGASASMQVEHLAVTAASAAGGAVGGASGWLGGAFGVQEAAQPWRVALSWKPSDATGAAGAAGGLGPRHEVGRVKLNGNYTHERTLQAYTRAGVSSVRSCFVPSCDPASAGGSGPPPQLASSDDRSRRPVVWSLRDHAGGAAGAPWQWLEEHPEPPTCTVAALGPGGGAAGAPCFLAASSASIVNVYHRRTG